MIHSKILFFIFTFFVSSMANGQIITVFAGVNDSFGYSGDGVVSTTAKLNSPYGVAVDIVGNVYIADGSNNRVRKVDITGIITTIAGNGTATHMGDGGPATAAGFAGVAGVAVDNAGNVYIAEDSSVSGTSGSWIRKIDALGIITTLAGNGGGYGGDGGPATAAGFDFITGIAVDKLGNVYIADAENNRVRKVNTSGIITTFAGNGTMGYTGDGGPASVAELGSPNGIAVDGYGNVFIDDRDNSRVRKVDSLGIITTIAGNGIGDLHLVSLGDGGAATAAELDADHGIAVDNGGNVYFTDLTGRRVRMVTTTGVITTVAGNGTSGNSGNGGPATAAELNQPIGVAIDGAGNIYISDEGNSTVRKVCTKCSGLSVLNSSKGKGLLNIHPNPTKFSLTITFTDKIASITITNLIGQTVFNNYYHNEEVQVDVSGFPAGLYFVTINGSEVRKFVKQ